MIKFLPVEWHDSLPSTNTCLVERVRAIPALPHGTVVSARVQTAGRGRQQRQWIAPANQNLTFSFLWNAPVDLNHIPSMAQAISIGICRALAPFMTPVIKWPNDVLVEGKKIAGILCERVHPGEAHTTVLVAGIGMNVNLDEAGARSIDQPVTSLYLETGRSFVVAEILDRLLDSLVSPLEQWSTSGFPAIRAEYARLGAAPGTFLRVRDGDQHVAGRLEGYSDAGGLMLALESGEHRVFYSGDVEHFTTRTDREPRI